MGRTASGLLVGLVVLIAGVALVIGSDPGGSTRRLGIPSGTAGWIAIIIGACITGAALARMPARSTRRSP